MEKTNLPSQTSAVTTSVNFFDPQQFETAQRMSKLFASSMLVPDTYQTDKIALDLINKKHLDPKAAQQQASMTAVANCKIALDIATRIGASPLMVMQNLVIIYGRPSWSSKFLIATVNTCGRFEPLKFRFTEKGNVGKLDITSGYEWDSTTRQRVAKTEEFDGTKLPNLECVAYSSPKGSKDVLESSPISIRMAVEEGWYTKNGSKWRTMPKQMLMYRAASFWTSAYAPELSMGMRTVEEEQDIIDITDTAEEVVDREIAHNANGETIGFDEDKPQDHSKSSQSTDGAAKTDAEKVPEGVDPDTGEILNPGAGSGKPADEGKKPSGGSLFPDGGPGY